MTTFSGEGCTLGDNCRCGGDAIGVKRSCDNWSVWSSGLGEIADPNFLTPDGARQLRKAMDREDAKKDSLTPLDRFALAALTGGMANPLNGPHVSAKEIAAGCYAVARAMMKERAK